MRGQCWWKGGPENELAFVLGAVKLGPFKIGKDKKEVKTYKFFVRDGKVGGGGLGSRGRRTKNRNRWMNTHPWCRLNVLGRSYCSIFSCVPFHQANVSLTAHSARRYNMYAYVEVLYVFGRAVVSAHCCFSIAMQMFEVKSGVTRKGIRLQYSSSCIP